MKAEEQNFSELQELNELLAQLWKILISFLINPVLLWQQALVSTYAFFLESQ